VRIEGWKSSFVLFFLRSSLVQLLFGTKENTFSMGVESGMSWRLFLRAPLYFSVSGARKNPAPGVCSKKSFEVPPPFYPRQFQASMPFSPFPEDTTFFLGHRFSACKLGGQFPPSIGEIRIFFLFSSFSSIPFPATRTKNQCLAPPSSWSSEPSLLFPPPLQSARLPARQSRAVDACFFP